jgi:hypothetical protein
MLKKLLLAARIMLWDQMVLSWRIGGKNFDGAIRILEKQRLRLAKFRSGAPDDEGAIDDIESGIIGMIAECHLEAKRKDAAIAAAREAHTLSPHNFSMNKLLASNYVKHGEHDLAAKHVLLSLNHPPTSQSIPKHWVRFWDAVLSVVPRFRGLATEMAQGLEDLNKEDLEWLAWAKRYLAWYNAQPDSREVPTIH